MSSSIPWQELSARELARLRKFGNWRVRGLGWRAHGRDGDMLLSDALFATAEGTRQWDPNKISLYTHLKGAMWSISSGWRDKKNVELVLESDYGSDEESPVAITALADDPDALRVLNLMAEGYTVEEACAALCLPIAPHSVARRLRRRLARFSELRNAYGPTPRRAAPSSAGGRRVWDGDCAFRAMNQ